MIVAYADPPYLGQGRHYRADHPQADEWNKLERHAQLIAQLVAEYPDGWALSASSPSLKHLLPFCPADVRIGAWCKSFGAFKRGVRPAYMWEPVIFRGGRNPPWMSHPPPEKNGQQTTPKDFIVVPITLKKGLCGAKPYLVCDWILEMLNVQAGDTVLDLFPGTRVMETAATKRGAGIVHVLRGEFHREVVDDPYEAIREWT